MAGKLTRSQTLRYLAEQFLAGLPDEVLTSPRRDLATSLVRQWLTNDGQAALFLGSDLHFLRARVSGPTTASVEGMKVDARAWNRHAMRDWDIDPDVWNEGMRQLNLGQSAVIETRRGESLRLWVNGRERRRGIEPLSPPRDEHPRPKMDLAQIARDELDDVFGTAIDPATRDVLAEAVAREWASNGGHAVLFTLGATFHLTFKVHPDGTSDRTAERLPTDLPDRLRACGVATDDLPHFLHALNLGHPVEIMTGDGEPVRFVVDPVHAEVAMQRLGSRPDTPRKIRFDDLTE
ncbi:MAG: hypothetical protein J2P46_12215 [Zavarzinella sp.]|nr:hypothetical protein [Zavarzinella sp.]